MVLLEGEKVDSKVPKDMVHEMLDEDFDAPADSELQYSEEMSRQAVGKLFTGGTKKDTDKRPLVKGFGQDSADERPPRQTARPQGAVSPVDDSEGIQKEKPREIKVVERGGRRRDSATTRSTMPEGREESFQSGVRAATGGRPDVSARQNPEQAAATQKGDTSPRQRVPRPAPTEGAKPAAKVPAEDSDGLDFDGFRQRYNPNELVSPPRNKNRPVRNPAARDVRKDRVRLNDGDLETVNTFRLFAFGGVVVVVLLIGILFFQNMSLRGQRNERDTQIAELVGARDENIALNARVQELQGETATQANRINHLEGILNSYNIDPDAPPAELGTTTQTTPGGGTPGPLPSPPAPLLPTTHTVASGESLAIIARRYFGQTFDLNDTANMRIVQEHIARDNSPPINMNNINHIEIGWVLTIIPFPMNPTGDD